MNWMICRIVGHHRDVERVWKDGYSHRAPCARCGAPLIKEMLGEWRLFDPERDYILDGTPRKPRPDHV